MRMIDADALKEKAWDAKTQCGYVQVVDVGDIDDAPTIEERKTGKWICSDDLYEYAVCSACKWDSGEAWEYALKRFGFCPSCGADMRGDDHEND